jgi:serine protease Do
MNLRRDLFRNEWRAPRHVKAGLGVLALMVLIALLGWNMRTAEAQAAPAAPARAAAVSQPATRCPVVESYADVVSRVAPAVVTIRAERRARSVALPFQDNPLLQQFFGDQFGQQRQQPREEGALGSGVIVRPDGYILTNYHVIEGAQHIQVDLKDRHTFEARVVGSDPPSDLAVLKIDATNLPTVPLGDSSKLRVGDIVLAIGNPLGVGQTVTQGIISAKGRATELSDGSFEDFLQTDAPINQGNSGGALVNLEGQLVGINSQIMTPSGGSVGIGFAIPSDMAANVMDQLITTGHVRRGMLGVTVQSMNSDIATSLGLKSPDGALVASVQPDSPAVRAGLRQGDVITTFDGRPIDDSNALRNRVASTLPGTPVTLGFVRDGKVESTHATLAELPTPRSVRAAQETGAESGRFGLSVEPITPDLASQMKLKDQSGLVVDKVAPMSPASDAGIQPGDVIKEVNHKPVTSVSGLQDVLRASTNKRPALVLLSRKGSNLFVALAPGE